MRNAPYVLDAGLHRRLVDSLYVEAMVMADEARGYFDKLGAVDRENLEPMQRILFSCESLKVTTRLMHVIAWLLAQRAWQRGEIDSEALADERFRLGDAAATDGESIAAFPFAAKALIEGSTDLYDRVARFEAQMIAGRNSAHDGRQSPSQDLIDRLVRSL